MEHDTFHQFEADHAVVHDWKTATHEDRVTAALACDQVRERARQRVQEWMDQYEAAYPLSYVGSRESQIVSYMAKEKQLLLDDLKILLHPAGKLI